MLERDVPCAAVRLLCCWFGFFPLCWGESRVWQQIPPWAGGLARLAARNKPGSFPGSPRASCGSLGCFVRVG